MRTKDGAPQEKGGHKNLTRQPDDDYEDEEEGALLRHLEDDGDDYGLNDYYGWLYEWDNEGGR